MHIIQKQLFRVNDSRIRYKLRLHKLFLHMLNLW